MYTRTYLNLVLAINHLCIFFSQPNCPILEGCEHCCRYVDVVAVQFAAAEEPLSQQLASLDGYRGELVLAQEDVSHGIDVGNIGLLVDDWDVAISECMRGGGEGGEGRKGEKEWEGRGKGGGEGRGGKEGKGEHGRRGSEQDSMPPQMLKQKLIVTCIIYHPLLFINLDPSFLQTKGFHIRESANRQQHLQHKHYTNV